MGHDVFDDEYDTADASYGDRYVRPGTYRLRLRQCVQKKSWKNVPAFIAECEVLESNNDYFQVGSTLTWYQPVKPDPVQARIAKGEIRKFVDVCANEPTDKEFAQAVVSTVQPLAGTILRCIASNRKTKSDRDFTVCEWSLIDMSPEMKKATAV